MSTRTNIVIKEGDEKLFFYRHSDGYPAGTMPTLNLFLKWLKDGTIRDNLSQSAGWLIMIGAIEYNTIPKFKSKKYTRYAGTKMQREDEANIMDTIHFKNGESGMDWKVGAYEPTTGIHGDIEYLYVIDLNKKEIKCYDSWTDDGEGKHRVSLKEEYSV